jgi:hypothetical protein
VILRNNEGIHRSLDGTVIGTVKIKIVLEANASERNHGKIGMTLDANESGMLTERLSLMIPEDGEMTANGTRGWLQDGEIDIQSSIGTKSVGGTRTRHGILQPNVVGCLSRSATGVRNV